MEAVIGTLRSILDIRRLKAIGIRVDESEFEATPLRLHHAVMKCALQKSHRTLIIIHHVDNAPLQVVQCTKQNRNHCLISVI
jgi:hypothetical protein